MRKIAVVLFALLVVSTCLLASERRDADIDRIQTASTVLSQIMSAPDRAIPDSIMSGAKCIAIMPSMLKGGFIIGANYGKGVATCRTDKGWSAPAFFKLTGGSFGFQAGGQASDLVLIIRTDDGMQHLLQSKFKLGADASAAAGPVGRDAQAMTDLTMRAQVLTYSRSRGLFAGVSLSGGVIKQDDADTQAFYGKTWTYYSVLNGQVPAPQDSQVLLNMVEKYAPTPKPRTPGAAPTPTSEPTAAAPAAESTASSASATSPTVSASAAPGADSAVTTTSTPAAVAQPTMAANETAMPQASPAAVTTEGASPASAATPASAPQPAVPASTPASSGSPAPARLADAEGTTSSA
jgi:lipid-binding SYLF domain-containing protein